MSKHTPGPWARYGSIIRSIACNDRKIADVRVIDDEGQANARLMAAAPDLLEALEAALTILTDSVGDFDYDKAMAAIAKAKGEQL